MNTPIGTTTTSINRRQQRKATITHQRTNMQTKQHCNTTLQHIEKIFVMTIKPTQHKHNNTSNLETNLATRFEGGSQATPSFWEVPGLPRKFPQLPRKFFGDFPGSSLTVELYSNPGVPRKFPRLPRKFPRLPRKFPGLPRRSAPFTGKPDTLS